MIFDIFVKRGLSENSRNSRNLKRYCHFVWLIWLHISIWHLLYIYVKEIQLFPRFIPVCSSRFSVLAILPVWIEPKLNRFRWQRLILQQVIRHVFLCFRLLEKFSKQIQNKNIIKSDLADLMKELKYAQANV